MQKLPTELHLTAWIIYAYSIYSRVVSSHVTECDDHCSRDASVMRVLPYGLL